MDANHKALAWGTFFISLASLYLTFRVAKGLQKASDSVDDTLNKGKGILNTLGIHL